LIYAKKKDVERDLIKMEEQVWKDHEKICKVNSIEIAEAVHKKLEETQTGMAEKIAAILQENLRQ
jgi:hypothetical protein